MIIDLFAGAGGASRERAARRLAEFHGLVQAPSEPDGCSLWLGGRARRKNGALSYGFFTVRKQKVLAHRMAWMLANQRPIPEGMVVRHSCDNVACVRSEHLSLGSQADNMADMWSKGRGVPRSFPSGPRHPNAKLTDEQVRDLRAARAQGLTYRALGERFEIHPTSAHAICAGQVRRTE